MNSKWAAFRGTQDVIGLATRLTIVPPEPRHFDKTLAKGGGPVNWVVVRHTNEVCMKFTVRPLTPDLWPALEDLFGKNGACDGCWRMYWRLGPAYFERPRENNRRPAS